MIVTPAARRCCQNVTELLLGARAETTP